MATNKKSSPIDIYNTVDAETLEKIIDVQFKSLIKHPEIADTLAPLMIWGSPGCGKSSVVREYCIIIIKCFCSPIAFNVRRIL